MLSDVKSYKDILQTDILEKLIETHDAKQSISSSIGNDTKLLNVKKANAALTATLKELKDKKEEWSNVDKELKEAKLENQNLKIEAAATKKALDIQTLMKKTDNSGNF